MAKARKVDSNITGLAYAEEFSPETLGINGNFETAVASGDTAATDWKRILPNSYADFGGELTTITPNPISPGRQRQKGAVSDLDGSGGFNVNLTFYGLRDLFAAALFANFRSEIANPVANRKYVEGNMTVTAAANAFPTIIGPDDVFEGVVPGQWVFVGGDNAHGASGADQFDALENNGFKRVRAIGATAGNANNVLTIDKSATNMTAEATAANVKVFIGRALRNETAQTGTTQSRQKSYHMERTLGDSESPARQVQSEYLTRATLNEFTLNIAQAALINCDFGFIAARHIQRTRGAFKNAAPYSNNPDATTGKITDGSGPLQPSAPQDPVLAGRNAAHASLLSKGKADTPFNTSSDFARIKMSTVQPPSVANAENVDPLFAFITEATITVANNLTPNKAVSVLGAFDVTAGTFAVSGSLTAYFADVAAVRAVQQNADVTLDMIMVKNNRGIVLDIPLIALGNGRLNVEVDTPITLPLSMDAGEASAAIEETGFDYTAMFTFFEELPDAADAC